MPKYVTARKESEIEITGTTASLGTTDGNSVFLSIGGWANKAVIDRIEIMANTNSITGPMDIRILSDPAAYRAAVAPAGESYVLAAWNNEFGVTGPNTSWKIDERYSDGVFTKDDTLSGMFHIMLEAEDVGGTTLSAPSTYTVKVYGRPFFDMEDYFNRQHIYNEVYWRYDSVTSKWIDFTLQSRNSTDTKLASRAFSIAAAAATDYFYVGASNQFTRVFFDVAAGNTTQIAITAQYFRQDATWQTLSVKDCTDRYINGASYTMGHPGMISWTIPAGWAGTDLSALTGTPPDAGWQFGASDPRYYVRFSLSDISTNPTFYSIRIASEILSGQR